MTICTQRNGTMTPFGFHGKLHVEGTLLLDEKNEPCPLRGVSTHNLSNYPKYINRDVFTQMADEWHITVIRLAMYSDLADGFHGYADGDDAHREELEDLIMKGVEYAADLGIYVLIDWHCLFDYDPNMHTDMAIHFFEKMCRKLAGYDHVIYEICNEPNQETTWEDIKKYANKVIPVIRKEDPDKVIIVGTPVWSQDVDIAAQSPLDIPNIMYTLHFYADTHREPLRDKMKAAIAAGLPIFVTEFGLCDASGSGPINEEQTNLWLKLLNENHISYVMWNLSNKDETSAFLAPTCTKEFDWKEEDLSACGKMIKTYMTK